MVIMGKSTPCYSPHKSSPGPKVVEWRKMKSASERAKRRRYPAYKVLEKNGEIINTKRIKH